MPQCVTLMSTAPQGMSLHGSPMAAVHWDVPAPPVVVISIRQFMASSHTEHHCSPHNINLVTCAHGSDLCHLEKAEVLFHIG